MVSPTSLLVPPLPRFSQRDLPKTSAGPLRLPQGPCYTASLHLVDFKCASSFGEAQQLSIGIGAAEKSGDQHARSEMEGLLNELS